MLQSQFAYYLSCNIDAMIMEIFFLSAARWYALHNFKWNSIALENSHWCTVISITLWLPNRHITRIFRPHSSHSHYDACVHFYPSRHKANGKIGINNSNLISIFSIQHCLLECNCLTGNSINDLASTRFLSFFSQLDWMSACIIFRRNKSTHTTHKIPGWVQTILG